MSNPAESYATVVIDGPELDALELVLTGLVAPIDGYCIPGQKPDGWPFESTLTVPGPIVSSAQDGGLIVLTDPDGTPLAQLDVTGVLRASNDFWYVAGALTPLKPAEHPPARAYRLTGAEDLTGSTLAVFGGEPEPADVARAVVAAEGDRLVFLALTWNTGHGDHRASAVVEALQRCSDEVPGSSTHFLALAPLSASATAEATLAHVVGILQPNRFLDFSSQRARDVAGASRPAAAAGCVILFTGLSGSGKSTVARALSERLSATGAYRPVLLDGDDVRRVLSAGLGFSAADREENLRRIGWVAAKLASVGGAAICAPIAPFDRTRAEIRAMAEPWGRFVLVHVATPLDVCEQRDRKGLYARARAGTIRDFTGIDSPYEVPDDADVVIDTSIQSIDECVDFVVEALESLDSPPPRPAGGGR